jgi:O-6-methylguanine DNA methyltransferase
MNSNVVAQLTELPIETSEGKFVARYSQRGLAALEFPSEAKVGRQNKAGVTTAPRQILIWHRIATLALVRVLAGKPPGKLPPLDLSSGTHFQRKVWRELRKIPAGQSRTYGEIARAIRKAKAVRAVGGACGANPIPVLVPCHRVLAANSKIGGFSGGLEWKKKLLKPEGIIIRNGGFAD